MKNDVLQAVALRLIEERGAMGLSQQAVADLTGKSRQQVINYETARSEMTVSFLVGLHELMFDVQYIVTGVRSTNFYEMNKEQTK